MNFSNASGSIAADHMKQTSRKKQRILTQYKDQRLASLTPVITTLSHSQQAGFGQHTAGQLCCRVLYAEVSEVKLHVPGVA